MDEPECGLGEYADDVTECMEASTSFRIYGERVQTRHRARGQWVNEMRIPLRRTACSRKQATLGSLS